MRTRPRAAPATQHDEELAEYRAFLGRSRIRASRENVLLARDDAEWYGADLMSAIDGRTKAVIMPTLPEDASEPAHDVDGDYTEAPDEPPRGWP